MGHAAGITSLDEQAARDFMRNQVLRGTYPNLAYRACKLVLPCSDKYNCIAWTVGHTRHMYPDSIPSWDWPYDPPVGDMAKAFGDLFTANGFSCWYVADAQGFVSEPTPLAGARDVAVYVDDDGDVSHGAYREGLGQWTSKLGTEGPVIEHALAELEGGPFGFVRCFVRRWP